MGWKKELDKRDKSLNQDTKDDELDENKYRAGDDLPYTPTVEKTFNKLYDSRKTFTSFTWYFF